MPSFVRWLTMAPLMTPSDNNAPSVTVLGTSNSTVAINSAKPEPMRPHGSMPRVWKMYFDSSAPVNLNKSVWKRITAAMSCKIQLVMVLALHGFMDGDG